MDPRAYLLRTAAGTGAEAETASALLALLDHGWATAVFEDGTWKFLLSPEARALMVLSGADA